MSMERLSKKQVVLPILVAGLIGASAALPAELLAYAFVLVLFLALIVLTSFRPSLLLQFVIVLSALAGLVYALETTYLGGLRPTLTMTLWLFVAGYASILFIARRSGLAVPKFVYVFGAYLAWAAIRSVTTEVTVPGLRSMLVFSFPLLIGAYAALLFTRYPVRVPHTVDRALLITVFVPPLLYALMIPAGLVELTSGGPHGFIGPRPIALYLLIVLALGLSEWRYGSSARARAWGRAVCLIAVATILFTLSRTASAVAITLIALSRTDSHKLWKLGLYSLIAVSLAIASVLMIPQFRERFFVAGAQPEHADLESIESQGRNLLWAVAFTSAMQHPIAGSGPGSARLVLGELADTPGEEFHPHNEYLQVFHDTGFVGLSLLLMAWMYVLVRVCRIWSSGIANRDRYGAKWGMASTLAVIAILATAVTDNTFHYQYVLAPGFILFALAFSRVNRRPDARPGLAESPEQRPRLPGGAFRPA